jgi:hypothetical protein
LIRPETQQIRFKPGKWIFFILLFSLLIICCKTRQVIPPPPPENEVSIAQKRWPEADSVSLHNGFALYSGKCNRCHELYKPLEYTEEEWDDVLPKMARKAHISPEEKELIRRYLFTRRTVLQHKSQPNK